jgi:tRNA G18 (ribose-2'-O)-methylase SpoU
MEDEDLAQIFADKDLVIIEKLKDLLNKSKDRERSINYVSNRIFKEIEGLDDYLNIMMGNNQEYK